MCCSLLSDVSFSMLRHSRGIPQGLVTGLVHNQVRMARKRRKTRRILSATLPGFLTTTCFSDKIDLESRCRLSRPRRQYGEESLFVEEFGMQSLGGKRRGSLLHEPYACYSPFTVLSAEIYGHPRELTQPSRIVVKLWQRRGQRRRALLQAPCVTRLPNYPLHY